MTRGRGYPVAGSGTLSLQSPNPQIPFGNATTDPCGWYISPDGKNAYVGLAGAGLVAQYSRDLNTGALTALAPATVSAGSNCYYLTGSADGKNIYAAAAGGNLIRQWSRDATTGALTPLSPFTIGTNGASAVCPALAINDTYLYCSGKITGGVGKISMYSRDTTTGKLTTLTPATVDIGAAGISVQGIVIYGNHVYAGVFSGNVIYGFVIDPATGQLAPMSPPTFTAAGTPSWICVSPDGNHVYVANDVGASVSQFSRDQQTGLLTALNPASVPGGNGPFSCVITPDGRNVYVGNSDGQTVSQYTRDIATGLLTQKVPSQVRSDPTIGSTAAAWGPPSIGVSPDGKNLYASGKAPAGHSVLTFNIRP